MVAFPNIYTVCQVMLKAKAAISVASVNSKNQSSGQKIWPLLLQKKTSNMEGLRLEDINGPCQPRPRPMLRNGRMSEGNFSAKSHNPESFHCAISPILGLAQLFGLFPLSGIRSPTPVKLQFTKFSFLTAYAASITTMVIVMAILAVIHMIRTLNAQAFEVQGGIGAATAGAIFYGNSLLGMIIFLWMSPRWPTLQRDWRAMEQFIDSNKSESPRLRWKFFLTTGIVLMLAVVEHVLSILNNTEGFEKWITTDNSTIGSYLQFYCVKSHAFILQSLEYNFVLGIYIFVVSKLATFTWNFTDLFIMLVSTGLAERYKCLNKRVMVTVTKQRLHIDWQELREDYAYLSTMVKKVDNDISPLILLSFANNLYFICLQLLNGLSRPSDGTLLSVVYFFGSFAFLIGRTCAVTLFAARINDQSKVALPYLYTCSASTYNIETERLQLQLTTDDISLTGLRFFSITRNFMLAVAGAIVTYEVVLLQFNVAMKT